MKDEIENSILESANIIKNSITISAEIIKSIELITNCLRKNHKLILFGNGGSAADAQHIAAELIGKYKLERKSYAAIALTTDSSIITALSNDYSFEMVFSRQCEGLVLPGDVVIGISTSGNSINVKNGLITAKAKGASTIGLLGNDGGQIKNIVDIPIIVKATSTPRIQEAHRVIYHIICESVEKNLEQK